MMRSTSPRARNRCPTLARSVPGTSCTAIARQAGLLGGGGEHLDEGHVRLVGRGRAAQQRGIAALQREPGGVDRHVGTGLVDHRQYAEGHPHLADLETVGLDVAAQHLADRIGQGRRRRAAPGAIAATRSGFSVSRSSRLVGRAGRTRRRRRRGRWRASTASVASSSASAIACSAASLAARCWPEPARRRPRGRARRPRGRRPRYAVCSLTGPGYDEDVGMPSVLEELEQYYDAAPRGRRDGTDRTVDAVSRRPSAHATTGGPASAPITSAPTTSRPCCSGSAHSVSRGRWNGWVS